MDASDEGIQALVLRPQSSDPETPETPPTSLRRLLSTVTRPAGPRATEKLCVSCQQPFRTHEIVLTWGLGEIVTEEQTVCVKRACDACVERSKASETEQRRAGEQQTVRDRWERAGLTERMFGLTLVSLDCGRWAPRQDDTTALDDGLWLIGHAHDDPPPWLVLWGPRGVGKTHLAVAVLLEICRRGGDAAFRTGKELMDELRASNEPRSGTSEAALQRAWMRLALLVIDDVGEERQTPYTAEAYWAILDGRYRAGLPLLITTHLNPDGLSAHIGEAAASRLSEHALMSEVLAGDSRVGARQGSLRLVASEPDDVPF